MHTCIMHIMLKIPVGGEGSTSRVLPYMGVIYGLNRYVPLKRLFASPTLGQSKQYIYFLEKGILHFILTLNQA